MAQYLEAFVLGNAAIIGNVCVLPLYPGLLAFLASQSGNRRSSVWLGALVLAGILSLMLLVGFVLFLLRRSIAALLPWLLPLTYGIVFVLGVVILLGYNPFRRLTQAQVPLLRHPAAAAYFYGLLLGPMTLPCTGPLVVSAFVLGTGNAGELAEGLLYFLAFGIGFGWPLVVLSVLSVTRGRRVTGWMARREAFVQRLSGVLLLAIALLGLWVDILPNFGLPAM